MITGSLEMADFREQNTYINPSSSALNQASHRKQSYHKICFQRGKIVRMKMSD
jgi:hypothetical protein